MSIQKVKIAFVNPPHADWSLANNLSYLSFQSHYFRLGSFSELVDWVEAPYRWNCYESVDQILDELNHPDILLCSSYVWNYSFVDKIAKAAKKRWPNLITVLGGPHIGTYEPEFLNSRDCYDFICRPTKPGETFVSDLIDSYLSNNGKVVKEDISWEIESNRQKNHEFNYDYSIYEDHFNYLHKIASYANVNEMELFIALETTRGCPYQCVYCEWGGGTGTKIMQRSLEWVKRDILAIKEAGFTEIYLTDANFGVFPERDMEIFEFAWRNGLNLTDISTVKTPRLEIRKALINSWFDIVGKKESIRGFLEKSKRSSISIVPTVSIQSISDRAMKVAQRVDLKTTEKIELSRHIYRKCEEQGFPVPALELILGMPGSTIDDFYQEFELIWNFKAWTSYRHDYMFLPDSELCSPKYLEKYKIKTVLVYSDLIDEDGVDNKNSFYQNEKTFFKTISSCESFCYEEMCEMWFMNHAGNFILRTFYKKLESFLSPAEFGKESFLILSRLDGFNEIWEKIKDLLDPQTPPCSIKRINGRYRTEVIEEFIKKNEKVFFNELLRKSYGVNQHA